MFDVGFSELVVLAIVALLVLGPEKLPHAARIAGAWMGRIRRTVASVQTEIEREVADQEIRSRMEKEWQRMGIKDTAQQLKADIQTLENSLRDVQQETRQTLQAAATTPVSAHNSDLPPPTDLLRQAENLDRIQIDGEKAYREWLQAQKATRPVSDASTSTHDTQAP